MKNIKISKRYRLEKAVSIDEDREPLQHIKIEGKQAIVTDGHILAAVPIENPNGEHPNVLLNPVVWKEAVNKKSKDDKYEIEVDTKANETGLVYPDWKRVVPEGFKKPFEVCFNAKKLFQLSEALGAERLILTFDTESKKRAILVDPYNEESEPDKKKRASGLIMPVRLYE